MLRTIVQVAASVARRGVIHARFASRMLQHLVVVAEMTGHLALLLRPKPLRIYGIHSCQMIPEANTTTSRLPLSLCAGPRFCRSEASNIGTKRRPRLCSRMVFSSLNTFFLPLNLHSKGIAACCLVFSFKPSANFRQTGSFSGSRSHRKIAETRRNTIGATCSAAQSCADGSSRDRLHLLSLPSLIACRAPPITAMGCVGPH